jgi:hypothetical protein
VNSGPLDFLHALHVAHAGDFAHAGYDTLQMFEVGDIGNQVNRGAETGPVNQNPRSSQTGGPSTPLGMTRTGHPSVLFRESGLPSFCKARFLLRPNPFLKLD